MSDLTKQPPRYQASSQLYQPPTQIQAPPQAYVQAQVYNVPPITISTYPAVQPVIQNEGWWRRTQKNKPQSNSAGSAALIFVSGGMNMAWELGIHRVLRRQYILTDHIICSWFIGGIIGAAVGAVACNKLPKKILLSLASILVTICGILQISDPDSYGAILTSRYLDGIAVGLVFPMTFVLVGEEVVKSLRGMNAVSVDTMSFGCGIFIYILYASIWSYELEKSYRAIQMCGILNMIYGVVAFVIGHVFLIESPLFYLVHGDEQMAIESLKRLQRPFTITSETYELLAEHKLYLTESKERTLLQSIVYGIPALLKLCIYRSFMALGFSYAVNGTFTFLMLSTKTQWSVFAYIMYGLARWLGPVLVAFTLDIKGRKSFTIFGFFVCTILAFSTGGILDDLPKHLFYDGTNYLNALIYILVFFQLFASMSLASSSAYISEAFPLPVKSYYMAIVFMTEMLVHIIIISCRDVFDLTKYFLTLGCLLLVFLCVAIFIMPETKCLSLRECLPKFRQTSNFRN